MTATSRPTGPPLPAPPRRKASIETGLLVSVRDADEARAALAGGAQVIDIKEPYRGPLGRADRATIAAVVDVVRGRTPVTAALGELVDRPEVGDLPAGLAAVKVGLRSASKLPWLARFADLRDRLADPIPLIPVAYADEDHAAAPPVESVLEALGAIETEWLVIDTWRKPTPDSLAVLGEERLTALIRRAAQRGVRVVLAGGLTADRFAAAVHCGPTFLGVRGAVCDTERTGAVSRRRVQSASHSLRAAVEHANATT